VCIAASLPLPPLLRPHEPSSGAYLVGITESRLNDFSLGQNLRAVRQLVGFVAKPIAESHFRVGIKASKIRATYHAVRPPHSFQELHNVLSSTEFFLDQPLRIKFWRGSW